MNFIKIGSVPAEWINVNIYASSSYVIIFSPKDCAIFKDIFILLIRYNKKRKF